MASDPPTLGMRIRRARERARLSQEQLAKEVGASKRAIGDWENDRHEPRNKLTLLEDVLGVDLGEVPKNPERPTREQLNDLRANLRETLGPRAQPWLDQLDAEYPPDA